MASPVKARTDARPCPLCGETDCSVDRTLNAIDIVRCTRCGFVFADVAEEVVYASNSRLDDHHAARYEGEIVTPFDKEYFHAVAEEFTRRLGPGRVLDFGCGSCLLLKCFQERGWECTGVDLSPWPQQYAGRYGMAFHQGRLEELALPEGAFDLVVSTSTFEHLYQPKPLLQQLYRTLKPGGMIFLSGMPNYRAVPIVLGLSNFYSNEPPHHVNYFTRATLGQLVATLPDSHLLELGSYGVPGAPQAYRVMKKVLGSGLSRKRVRQGDDVAEPSGATAGGASRAGRLVRLGVFLYRKLGTLFGLGSKLEVCFGKGVQAGLLDSGVKMQR